MALLGFHTQLPLVCYQLRVQILDLWIRVLLQKALRLINALVQKLDSMELEKVLMTEEIAALKTNPAYVELIARKQLGLVRTGEVVFYLPESTKSIP